MVKSGFAAGNPRTDSQTVSRLLSIRRAEIWMSGNAGPGLDGLAIDTVATNQWLDAPTAGKVTDVAALPINII